MKEIKESPSRKFRRLIASSLLYLKLPRKIVIPPVEENDDDIADNLEDELEDEFEDDLEEDELDEEFEDDEDEDEDETEDDSSITTGSGFNFENSSAPREIRGIFGPKLWNIASVISLSLNAILVLTLCILMAALASYGMKVSDMLNLGTSILGGLYTNFEKMDRAHITTTIPINTTIPVQFDLAISQETSVVLSQDVTINNARVTVNTGGLNITQADTTIVLPQGTNLPINLNLTVPVNTSIPVVLDVPVDIPLQSTQLHEPFSGLQDVIRPIYCLIKSNAVNLDGNPICQ